MSTRPPRTAAIDTNKRLHMLHNSPCEMSGHWIRILVQRARWRVRLMQGIKGTWKISNRMFGTMQPVHTYKILWYTHNFSDIIGWHTYGGSARVPSNYMMQCSQRWWRQFTQVVCIMLDLTELWIIPCIRFGYYIEDFWLTVHYALALRWQRRCA